MGTRRGGHCTVPTLGPLPIHRATGAPGAGDIEGRGQTQAQCPVSPSARCPAVPVNQRSVLPLPRLSASSFIRPTSASISPREAP